METEREIYCMNCFSLIPAEVKFCHVCGEHMAGLSAQHYRVKLLHALQHPLDDVRMRAIIALGLRREAGTAMPMAECALRHPLNIEEGIEVVNALKKFPPSADGRRALEMLAHDHSAHAVRAAAEIALQRTQAGGEAHEIGDDQKNRNS
jgi:hypothetical protein